MTSLIGEINYNNKLPYKIVSTSRNSIFTLKIYSTIKINLLNTAHNKHFLIINHQQLYLMLPLVIICINICKIEFLLFTIHIK